jgi:PPK2 family polyphosphate:nucleotide phosphotransferase
VDSKLKAIIREARELDDAYAVTHGRRFRLKDHDPGDTGRLEAEDKPRAKKALRAGIEHLAALQDTLYANGRWAVLLVFQAMDAAGKDSAIKHVMSGINPQGCQVTSFKAPSPEELDHDYLWRSMRRLPERGRIGIFNRSYYEEVLIVRVHQAHLARQKLPPGLVTRRIWKERYEDIRNFERYLARNGVVIRKFFLNLSRAEQKRRFLARIDNPDKNWKFSTADAEERRHWRRYMRAYEEMIRETATEYAPWYVVPADNKWYTRIIVAAAIIEALAGLDLHYPKVDATQRKALAAARHMLLKD